MNERLESWRSSAKCKGMGCDFFFPEAQADMMKRKSFCNDCIVQRACLAYALLIPNNPGIWGGTSEKERIKLLRSRQADAIVVAAFGRAAR